jgi:hypothetical protein
MAQARLAERDQRRVDRLVRAALGPERDPARRRDEQEARVLVAGVVERIEAAGDERVVERADREQPLAEQVAGEAGAASIRNRLFSAMPSSICWPCLSPTTFAPMQSLPARKRRHFAAEQAALVDPGAEVGRDGDVGRGGDDAVGEVAAGLGQVEQDAAERGLGRLLVAGGRGDRGDRDRAEARGRFLAGDPRLASISASTPGAGIVADAFERLPFLALATPIARAARPSASGSSGRRDCPCGRRTAGRSP